MNKNKLTLGVLTILFSSSAVASNAVLNVEGEIQINGKTVIDSTGSFVGSQADSSIKVINLSDYYSQNGTYVYKSTTTSQNWDGEDDISTCTETYVLTDTQETSEVVCDGSEYPSTWVWTDNGDDTYTTTSKHYTSTLDQDGNTSSGWTVYTRTYKDTDITDNGTHVALGTSLVTLYEYTLVESDADYEQDEIGKTQTISYSRSFSGLIPTFIVNEENYSNCYLDSYTDSDYSVRCAGVGRVLRNNSEDNTYSYKTELMSFEPSASAMSANRGVAQKRKIFDLVTDYYKKQALK